MPAFALRLQKTLWNKKIPFFHFILSTLIFLSIILWQYKIYHKKNRQITQQTSACPPPAVVRYRMSNYLYAKPLLLFDIINERDNNDPLLNKIKGGISQIIDQNKSSGQIHIASVYLRELNSSGFIAINDNEDYHPASLAKIPKMMTILRQSEITPGLLDKEITYTTELPAEGGAGRNQTFKPAKSIQVGHKYSIKELLYYMITESDNNANRLINTCLDETLYEKLFTDLNLPSPYSGLNSGLDLTLSASEFSKFMRMLYNASYLTNEHADYALSLLTHSQFKEGILKAIPPDITVAHKFGEFGKEINGKPVIDYELHESAIIYINNDPLLLTIMTKGKNQKNLAQVIAEITAYIYNQEKKPAS